MSFLRWCGPLKTISSSKTFSSNLHTKLNSLGLKCYEKSAPKIFRPPSKVVSPFVIKCSIFGVSAYLSVRYLDFKSVLPTAKCRSVDTSENVAQFSTNGEQKDESQTKTAEDHFPVRQFLR